MAKVKLSKAKTAIIIIAAIIFALLVAGGIYCVATDQSPATAIEAATAHQDKLVGKWQSQKSPGLSAYVFYDDGTYDSYLSTVNFSGEYTVKGNKITLTILTHRLFINTRLKARFSPLLLWKTTKKQNQTLMILLMNFK